MFTGSRDGTTSIPRAVGPVTRGRTARVLTRRIDGDDSRRVPDYLIVEEPMSIRLDGELVATTMRTPGDDFELAVGFCVTEGVLADAPVRTIRYCGEGPASEGAYNDVTVDTGGLAPPPTPRLGPASSSCGICGTVAIHELLDRLSPMSVEPFEVSVLTGIAGRIAGDQALFGTTGSVHAAAAFDRSGGVVLLREDIGRHNAVDKVVGRRRPGPVGQRSRLVRDGPEGLGCRIRRPGGGERPVGASRGDGTRGRPAVGRLRQRITPEPVHGGLSAGSGLAEAGYPAALPRIRCDD